MSRSRSRTLITLGSLLGLAIVVASIVSAEARAHPIDPRWHIPEADIERGRAAIAAHGCGACHSIPGVGQATGRVGPPLHDLTARIYLAGLLPNTPENLMRWIQDPQQVSPGNVMPSLNLSTVEVRDIAAYLYAASR